MSRNDYWDRDEFDTPDVEVFDDPLEWAAYWHTRGSHEDVVSLTLIDIADSLREIVAHLDGKETPCDRRPQP